MRKALTAITIAASIAELTVAAPTKAEAGCRGCWIGIGIAAGLIGSAIIARNAYGYGYYGGYGYAPAYYGYYPAPVYSYRYRPAYYGYAPTDYTPRYYYAPRRYLNYRNYRHHYRYYRPRQIYYGR
jgi:hypothetical protein